MMNEQQATTTRTLFNTLPEDNFTGILRLADYSGRDPVSSRGYQSLFLSPSSPFRSTATKSFSVLQLQWSKHFAYDFQFANETERCIIFDTRIMYKTASQVLRLYGSTITEVKLSGFNFSNLDHWEPTDVKNFAALIVNLCPLLSAVTVIQQSDDFFRLLMHQLQGHLKSISVQYRSTIPLSEFSTCTNLRFLCLYGPYHQVSSLDELWIAIGGSLESLHIHFDPPSWPAFCTGVSEHCRNLRSLILHPAHVFQVPETDYCALLRSYRNQLINASPLNLTALSLLRIARECPNLRCKLNVEPSQFSRVMALAHCVEHLRINADSDNLDNVLFTRAVEKCTQMVSFELKFDEGFPSFNNGPVVLPPSASLHLERVELHGLSSRDCDTFFANCVALKEVTIFTKLENLDPHFFLNLITKNRELHTVKVTSPKVDQTSSINFENILYRIVNQLTNSNKLRLLDVRCVWRKWRPEFRDLLMPLHRLNTKCVFHLANGRFEVCHGDLVSFPRSMMPIW